MRVLTSRFVCAEKANYRYTDFYCFMSRTDFATSITRDDDEGDNCFSISSSEQVI